MSTDAAPSDPRIAEVVQFWREAGPSRWFAKDSGFDATFKARFLALHEAAARRELDAWSSSAEGALALMILLDQFPRNAFRGTAHMYATDPLARHFAQEAIDAGLDAAVDPELRLFMYLPFGHSEDPADQARSVTLQATLGPDSDRHARGHQDIVRRFGRFPHRNALLGRESTAAELAYLRDGGFAG